MKDFKVTLEVTLRIVHPDVIIRWPSISGERSRR